MKRILLTGLLLSLLGLTTQAQVKDISVTFSPAGEYTWWDNETILKDNPFVGGRIGFGFGQYFEVRGLYMKSMDLKGTLEDTNWSFAKDLAKDIEDTEVDITRIGGELKTNIFLSNKFAPYITLGTGIQKLKYKRENQKKDEYKEEQIYASAGLGVKVHLSDRIVLALEGRNTMFNMNPNNQYLDPEVAKSGENKRLYNWSALASLEFYLGGRNPNEMTELDKAYRNSFRGGMSGMKFSVEPGGMYINFDDNSPFSDSYFWGVGAGIDFSDYVGIRGFYYQSAEDKDLKLGLDNSLQIYGGNILARLHNNLTGVAPYLSLGGGYLNPADDYKNEEGNGIDEGSFFAMAGLGIEIPLSKNILAYGSANYMVTTSNDVKDLSRPSELDNNIAYRAGVRFQLGHRSEKTPESILASQKTAQQNELSELKSEYENRISKLNKKLDEAYADNNVNEAVTILKERNRCEKELKEVDGIQVVNNTPKEMVRMSREEFDALVNEVLKKVDETPGYEYERITQLENALLKVNAKGVVTTETKGNNTINTANAQILEELQKLNKKVDNNTEMITKSLITPNKAILSTTPESPKKIVKETTIEKTENGQKITTTNKVVNSSMPTDGFAVFTGPSFGDAFSWNLGLRAYYQVAKTKNFKFMPEAYIGFGENFTYGISGNIIYQFNGVKKGKIMNPYAGLGLGFFKHDDFKLGTNIIIGTEINVLKGKVFVDYSTRNLLKNNQFAIGYRFTF